MRSRAELDPSKRNRGWRLPNEAESGRAETEFSGIFTQEKQHFRKQRAERNTQKFPAVETASTLSSGLT